jgi:hypothetical protein
MSDAAQIVAIDRHAAARARSTFGATVFWNHHRTADAVRA